MFIQSTIENEVEDNQVYFCKTCENEIMLTRNKDASLKRNLEELQLKGLISDSAYHSALNKIANGKELFKL